jgi:ubiquinone/menaquinone biosynthesis C-methylase UbiE
MTIVVPFEPRRFETSARYYLTGRPAYALRAVKRVVDRVGLTRSSGVLDLGCGPGQLAVAFAAHSDHVLGLDPEPEMLAVASEFAAAHGVSVRLEQGSSFDLHPELGAFRLVTIGRAFHWMDRPATLATLDRLVEQEGAVVLFSDKHPKLAENKWTKRFHEILAPYADDYEPRVVRRSDAWSGHDAYLLDSAFRDLERISVVERRHTPVAHLIDRAFSLSATSPARLGDKRNVLQAELEAFLQPLALDGLVTEVVETTASIATRPLEQGIGV